MAPKTWRSCGPAIFCRASLMVFIPNISRASEPRSLRTIQIDIVFYCLVISLRCKDTYYFSYYRKKLFISCNICCFMKCLNHFLHFIQHFSQVCIILSHIFKYYSPSNRSKHSVGRQSVISIRASTLSPVRVLYPIATSILSPVRVLHPIVASTLSPVKVLLPTAASILSAVRILLPIGASILSAVRVLYPIVASTLSPVRVL